jgi:hypothetical protein
MHPGAVIAPLEEATLRPQIKVAAQHCRTIRNK